jgi:PAS domain S-box-containing protein
VLDALVDVLLVVDPVGTIVYASPSVTKALGYDADELPTRPLAELFHSEDQGAVEAQPIERLRVQAKDGSCRTVSGMSRRLMIGESIVDVLVTLHDVTNLLGLERQLEAADPLLGNTKGGA